MEMYDEILAAGGLVLIVQIPTLPDTTAHVVDEPNLYPTLLERVLPNFAVNFLANHSNIYEELINQATRPIHSRHGILPRHQNRGQLSFR